VVVPSVVGDANGMRGLVSADEVGWRVLRTRWCPGRGRSVVAGGNWVDALVRTVVESDDRVADSVDVDGSVGDARCEERERGGDDERAAEGVR
jgi:hypothetical protein